MDHLCYLCLVFNLIVSNPDLSPLSYFVMLLRLFISALWSPAGNGLSSWLSFVMFNCVLSVSHVVSLVRCETWLYRFLIFANFLTWIV